MTQWLVSLIIIKFSKTNVSVLISNFADRQAAGLRVRNIETSVPPPPPPPTSTTPSIPTPTSASPSPSSTSSAPTPSARQRQASQSPIR
ncbi:hypothetical protein H2248_002729 [Termitomyces sp. 'cryptogamus']|nr:hypothetical protein H2248_002729 [Termitomyces sp. 'cryptogamus']